MKTSSSNMVQYPVAITKDDKDNVFVTGYSYTLVNDEEGSRGSDIFYLHYDSNGRLCSSQIIASSSGNDIAWAIAVGSNSQVYLTGEVGGDLPGQSSLGGSDVVLVSVDSDQNQLLFSTLAGSSSDDVGYSLALDLEGDVYVCGYASGSVDGQSHSGGLDILLLKYNRNGEKLLTRLYGTAGNDVVYSMVFDELRHNLHMVGYTMGDWNNNHQTNSNTASVLLMTLALDSDTISTHQTSSPSSSSSFGVDMIGRSVAIDSSGSVYIVGRMNVGHIQPQIEGLNSFLIKYSALGHKLFTKMINMTSEESGLAVMVDQSDSVYVSGHHDGSLFLLKYDNKDQRFHTLPMQKVNCIKGCVVTMDTVNNVLLARPLDYKMNGDNVLLFKYPLSAADLNGVRLTTRVSRVLHGSGLSDNDVAAIVVPILVGTAILMLIAYYIINGYRERMAVHMVANREETHGDVTLYGVELRV
eukprot:scaffold1884_cov343-Ochromonas_danica.AAC.54